MLIEPGTVYSMICNDISALYHAKVGFLPAVLWSPSNSEVRNLDHQLQKIRELDQWWAGLHW